MPRPRPRRDAFRLQEITLRVQHRGSPTDRIPIPTAATLAQTFRHLALEPREALYGIYCNLQKRLIAYERVSAGSMLESEAHPAEIVRTALLTAATSVCLLHNHPMGAAAPSPADESLTAEVAEALNLFGIPLTDHVILAPDGTYYSFYEAGMLPRLQALRDTQTVYTVSWTPAAGGPPVLEQAVLSAREAHGIATRLRALATAGRLQDPAVDPARRAVHTCKTLLRTYPDLRMRRKRHALPLTPSNPRRLAV